MTVSRPLLRIAAVPLWALAVPAVAAPDAALGARSALGAEKLLELVVALVLVLALAVALGWLGRRLQHTRQHGGGLRTLAAMSVGPKERVLIIEAGGERLLVGVAPGRVSTLHVLDPQAVPELLNGAAGGFGEAAADGGIPGAGPEPAAGRATGSSFARIQAALCGRPRS